MIVELMLIAQLSGAECSAWLGKQQITVPCELYELAKEYRDAGELIEGHHCPVAGPGDGNCVEWCGAAPSIGALDPCPPNAPQLEIQDG